MWQQQFEALHRGIRLDYDNNPELQRARDTILQMIAERLGQPDVTTFPQGSYVTRTGILPMFGKTWDVDIGVELPFPGSIHALTAIQAKKRVEDAFSRERKLVARVEIRTHCVRLTMAKQGRSDSPFHVDLPVYLKNPQGQRFLAVGREHSKKHCIEWSLSHTRHLTTTLSEFRREFPEQQAQFRRIVCYLKQWRSIVLQYVGGVRPSSVALTLAAFHGFRHCPNDDRSALLHVLAWMRDCLDGPGEILIPGRAVNVIDEMTALQRAALAKRVGTLERNLHQVTKEGPNKASQRMRPIFGACWPDKFPDRTA